MSFFDTTFVGYRRAAPVVTKGIAAASVETLFTFGATKHPITGREQQALPEGIRSQAKYALITSYALRTTDEKTGLPADRVEIDGQNYIVIAVEPWSNGLLPHNRAIVGLDK